MLLIGDFLVLPALLIWLAAVLPLSSQVKLAIVALAVNVGAPFVPWLVSRVAQGNLGDSIAITGNDILIAALTTIVVVILLMDAPGERLTKSQPTVEVPAAPAASLNPATSPAPTASCDEEGS